MFGLSLAAQVYAKNSSPETALPDLNTSREVSEIDDPPGESLGQGVAARVDRIIKKNAFQLWGEPWTIQGLPILFPGGNTGLNLGLRILLNNMKRTDPHKLEIEAQVLSSDRGRYKYFLRFDQPHAFDGKFRIQARVSYDRDINLPYFGVGNETPVNRAAFQADTVLYQNIRTGPSVQLQVFRHLGKYWRIGPIMGMKWTNVTAPSGSLIEADQPLGIAGGRTHYAGIALAYDGLDFEPYPTRGSYHELYLAFYNPAFGSNYSFNRATYSFRHYTPLHKELTFAHRTFFEALEGQVPFYELGLTGGTNPQLAFGGDKFFRGFQANRFIDRVRVAFGFELRWDPIEFSLMGQEITFGFVPFVDVGRVWNRLLPFELGRWHASTGWGARLTWNRRLTLRGDFAMTQEGTQVYFEFGHSF